MKQCFASFAVVALISGYPVFGAAVDAQPNTPATALPNLQIQPQPSPPDSSDDCYAQSRTATGSTSSCDSLIEQAQSATVAPNLLAAAYNNRGLIISRRRASADAASALEGALRDFDNAAQLAPTRVEPIMNQANLLLQLGRLTDALALYDRIIALPGTATAGHVHIALFNRAIAYRAYGDLQRAQADLAQARTAEMTARGSIEGIKANALSPVSPQ